MEKLKIIYADDHKVMREGFRVLLRAQHYFNAEFLEAEDGQQAVDLYRLEKHVDIIILDIRMPKKDGLTACKEILEFDPQAKIIFLSIYEENTFVTSAFEVGAKGYIIKSAGIDEILTAIQTVCNGGEYISGNILSRIVHNNFLNPDSKSRIKSRTEVLTKRERDVLELISKEKTSQEIALELDLSKRTVEKHRYKLMSKLNTRSTVGLIKKAISQGWIGAE